MYYIQENEKIVLFDENKEKLENTILFMPQYKEFEIKETDKKIVNFEGEFYFDDDATYLTLLKERETQRISNISLTRADVFESLILARGLTKNDLRLFIENDDSLTDIQKILYLNRFDDALEFYRKHPAIDFIATKLNITSENMDKFFDTKDYTYLKNDIVTNSSVIE